MASWRKPLATQDLANHHRFRQTSVTQMVVPTEAATQG
jgi:hypothetical protein